MAACPCPQVQPSLPPSSPSSSGTLDVRSSSLLWCPGSGTASSGGASAWEVDISKIQFEREVGSGSFGKVR